MESREAERNALGAFIVFFAGMLSQALWLVAVPFSWTWDSSTNLAVGRFYFHLPVEHWNVWQYYAPGYGLFLSLLGIHHFDTLAGVRFGILIIGGLMPLLLFLMMWPVAPRAALVASLGYALTFGNAMFSTNLLTYHLCAFTLLLIGVFFTRHLTRPSLANLVALALAAALANAVRQIGFYVFLAAVAALVVPTLFERTRIWAGLKSAVLTLAIYAAATSALSLARQAVLGGPFQFGLARDIGGRVALQAAYYPASVFLREFYPADDPVLVRPENGPASRKLYQGVAAFFLLPGVDFSYLVPDDPTNRDAALRNLISSPVNITNTYVIWWALDRIYGIDEGDRIAREAVLETIFAQPRIMKYYIWNFWQSLFGPPMNLNYACRATPCFAAELPKFYGYEFTDAAGEKTFSRVAGPALIAEMKREHERADTMRPYGESIYAVARLPFVFKPLLTALLFASVLLATGRARSLAAFCLLAMLANNATTSLAWPMLPRYWTPVIPLIHAGAAIAVVQIVAIFAAIRPRRTRSS
jgi:hypothetical protein